MSNTWRAVSPCLSVLVVVLLIALNHAGGAQAQQPETPTPEPTPAETPTVTPTMVPVEVVLQQPPPALSNSQTFILVVIAALAAAGLLLAGMYMSWAILKDHRGAEELNLYNLTEWLFQTLFQAAALVSVVVAVFILGLQGKIGDQGLVGIFSSIVGYVLGRASAGGAQRPAPPENPPPPPAAPSPPPAPPSGPPAATPAGTPQQPAPPTPAPGPTAPTPTQPTAPHQPSPPAQPPPGSAP